MLTGMVKGCTVLLVFSIHIHTTFDEMLDLGQIIVGRSIMNWCHDDLSAAEGSDTAAVGGGTKQCGLGALNICQECCTIQYKRPPKEELAIDSNRLHK
eukprot:CAMPEP_0172443168 /NCGR_PEP_ID=MMETSP1065-20121228/3475_1 /TAXON_ID=265537 /ORGANISM="Amphiprora paludosa, Strain CCMP125" /LENGTH=97 /DNA_ID=CAMNT_0013193305 /DNA_START=64 /DNA_END=357 /DNA_ORIENTATION=+